MGTQGIVSVVKDGRVAAKIVAGCNGFNAPLVAQEIRNHLEENLRTDIFALYTLAREAHLGCPDCLVVMNASEFRTAIATDFSDDTSDRYRRTFDDPEFNPRWDFGGADYVEVVDLDAPA